MMDGCVYFPRENTTVAALTLGAGGTLNNSLLYKFCKTGRRVTCFFLSIERNNEKRRETKPLRQTRGPRTARINSFMVRIDNLQSSLHSCRNVFPSKSPVIPPAAFPQVTATKPCALCTLYKEQAD